MKKRIRTTSIILAFIFSIVVGIYFFWPSYKNYALAVHGVSFTTISANKSISLFVPTSVELLQGEDWDLPTCGFNCPDIDLGHIPPGAIPSHLQWENCDTPDNYNCPGEQWCLRGDNGQTIQRICPVSVSQVNDGGTCTVVICDVINDDLILNYRKDLKQMQPEYLEDLIAELDHHLPDDINVLHPNKSTEPPFAN